VKEQLKRLLSGALHDARAAGRLPAAIDLPAADLQVPRDPTHGDLATNVAMMLAKTAGMAPRAIAEAVLAHLHDPTGFVARAEVAGPGFINFTFSDTAWRQRLGEILQHGEHYGSTALGGGVRVQVEFVSANPTGPLHVGHGRGAAVGDAIARILEAAGYDVDREYYVNDAGNQMETLGRSIWARYLALAGRDVEFPSDGYPGDYVVDLARELTSLDGPRWLDADPTEAAAYMSRWGGKRMLERIRDDLGVLGIRFDRFVSERELRETGLVQRGIDDLRARGELYEQDGALWFRSTAYGDDKDRPVLKSDGELTYFAADIGYHRDKFERGYERVIDVWGADHHGYIKRVEAALRALGRDPAAFRVVLVQIVNITRDGVPVRMGKRSGEFVALRDIIDEVGPDLSRFFFLTRNADAQLEFDLELARRQSAENPVFYIQYAHTRISGIFRSAADRGISLPVVDPAAADALTEPEEIALIKLLDSFPDVVEGAAAALEPHRVVYYAQKLAGEFHRYYSRHRCVTDDAGITNGRLLLVSAVQLVIRRALGLVGVSAPERM
jgi:arginyl-tRNA synthetase